MMFEDNATTEFLEACIKDLIENPDFPNKIVLAYINSEGVNISYKSCTYEDLQRVGQEILNEGMFRLIAYSEDKIKRIRDESEAEPDDESDDA